MKIEIKILSHRGIIIDDSEYPPTAHIDKKYIREKIEKVLRNWHLCVMVSPDDFNQVLDECVVDL